MSPSASVSTASSTRADLIAYIRDQRWFGARSKDITGIALVDAVPLPGDGRAWLALVELRFETGTHETYQLVLGTGEKGAAKTRSPRSTTASCTKRVARPGSARLIVNATPTGTTLEGLDGSIEFRGIGPRPGAGEDAEVRPLGVDQSNTSLVVGELDPGEDVPAARGGSQP